MMELALEDSFANLLEGQPQSPGVTSLLRHCINDEDAYGFEVNSSSATEKGMDFPGVQPTAFVGLLSPRQPEEAARLQLVQPSWAHLKEAKGILPLPDAVAATSLPAFTLGPSSPSLMPSSSTVCAGISVVPRRRGRKPKPRLPDLQHRLDCLNDQFKKLSNENIFLRNKLKVLERVVPYRDESVGFLTQLFNTAPNPHKPASCLLAEAPADSSTGKSLMQILEGSEQTPTTSGDADSRSSGSGLSAVTAGSGGEVQSCAAPPSASMGSEQPGGVTVTTGTATNRNKASAPLSAVGLPGLGRRATTPAQHKPQPPRSQQSAAGGTPALLALCPSPDGEVPAITLATLEDLKRVTPAEFRVLWKHICLQLGVLVTGAEVHGLGSSPYVRLERFLKRALSYMDKITLLCPICFVHSMYTNIETGLPERPADSFWMTCARSLGLSPQQLREVNSLAAVYEQNVVPVVQQRLQLSMQLSARLAAATAPQRSSSSSDALTTLASVDELAEQLERNVLKEHQTHWNIGDFLCSSVLTPLQVAKALSVAYPYIPDGVAMLHAFKLITAQDDAQAAQRATAAAAAVANPSGGSSSNPATQPPQSGGPNQFPSLLGLLASHLPALAAGLATSSRAQPAAQPLVRPLQQQAGSAAGAPPLAAVLAKLAGCLPPAQLQQLLAVGLQQPAQLQQLLAGLQAATPTAPIAAQPASLGAGPVAFTAASSGVPGPVPVATAQVQSAAALLAALTAAQQPAGRHPATTHAGASLGHTGGPL